MCDRCANIDYPIGDSIWLPCGGLASRYRSKQARERGYSDQDGDGWAKVGELVASLNRQRAEIERLQNVLQRPTHSRESFEGVE